MVESSWRSPRGETSAKVSRSCWPMWFFRWRRPFSKEQIGMGQGLGVGRHKDVKGKKYYYCILLLLYSSHFFLLLNFDALERSRLNKCIVAGLRRSDRKWWVVHGLSDLLMDGFSAGLPQPVKVWFKTTHDGTGISGIGINFNDPPKMTHFNPCHPHLALRWAWPVSWEFSWSSAWDSAASSACMRSGAAHVGCPGEGWILQGGHEEDLETKEFPQKNQGWDHIYKSSS